MSTFSCWCLVNWLSFTWILAPPSKKKNGVINNWATNVSTLAEALSQTAALYNHTHSSTSCCSSTKWISQQSTSNPGAKIIPKSNSDSDREVDLGPLLDGDEIVGNEQDVAVNSPPINGVHTTNSICIPFNFYTYSLSWIFWGIVKIGVSKALGKQPCEKNGQKLVFNNKDLPASVHKHFILTFLWWVRKQPDPWNLVDNDAVNALQQIWDKLYPNIPYKVKQWRDTVLTVAHSS